jgi:hypothetical protein
MAGLQFLMFLFLVPETLWVPNEGAVKAKEAVLEVDLKEKDSELEQSQEEKAIANHVEVDTNDTATRNDATFVPVTPMITSLQAEMSKDGHCGMAWKPWKEPGRFIKTMLAPIGMVSSTGRHCAALLFAASS